MDEKHLLEVVERLLEAVRDADQEAVRLRHQELSERLDGFPQEFARRAEFNAANDALQRLERDTVAREIYDEQHDALVELVNKLDRDKLDEKTFLGFAESYQTQREEDAAERRAVAAALAATVERRQGSTATWKQIAAVITISVAVLGLVLTFVGIILTFVVLVANHTIG